MVGRRSHATITGDRRVLQLLTEMQDRTTGVAVIWPKVGDFLADEFRKQFDTQGAYFYSRKWKALSPDYLRWKISHGYDPRILRQTGAMALTFTSRPMAVEVYRPMSATFGSDDPKAKWHQNGTRYMSRRQIIRVTGDLSDGVSSIIARYIFENRLDG